MVSDRMCSGLRRQALRGSIGVPQMPFGSGGGGEGNKDYNKLDNLPSIEDVILKGNKTFAELGLLPMPDEEVIDLYKNLMQEEYI